jgi:hypothetical protein
MHQKNVTGQPWINGARGFRLRYGLCSEYQPITASLSGAELQTELSHMKAIKITAIAMSLGLLSHVSAQERPATAPVTPPSAVEGGRSAADAQAGRTDGPATAREATARAGSEAEAGLDRSDEARARREAAHHPEDSGIERGAPVGADARGGRAASGAPGFRKADADPAPVEGSHSGTNTGAPTGADARGGRAANPAPGTR